jgi:pyridoxine 5-phosphate synthase
MSTSRAGDRIRLHVNIDHVATVRNARGVRYPCPVEAAELCMATGADGITAHLREDRRHIRDEDVRRLRERVKGTFNLEMAATDEMVAIAVATKPDIVTLVPERREERTTEGGLDVVGGGAALRDRIGRLLAARIPVSLFIAPSEDQLVATAATGSTQVEFHTGEYAHLTGEAAHAELGRLASACMRARALGLEVALGHGITLANVGPLAAIAEVQEFNIGHALIGDAIFLSLAGAVRAYRTAIDAARAGLA